MKKNSIKSTFVALAAFALCFGSCDDEKMEWEKDPSYGEVTTAELPLALREAISRYEALNSYTSFTLGIGIDLSLYLNDGTYRSVVNQNFDEITVGYDMKHGAMVNAQGEVSFTRADALIEQLKAAGLSVYGHTLAWHQNQNAGYLNKLIAPEVIPGPAGESLIDGDFENGMGGFSPNFNADDYSIADDEALSGAHSLQAVVGSGAGGKYDAQLTSPSFPIIENHQYEISFWIKASDAGTIGIDFPSGELGNQYPYISGSELAAISTTWTQVIINPETTGAMVATADNNEMNFRLLLGNTPSVTYWIDNVVIIDLDAEPVEFNYVENGDFESGDFGSWIQPNPGAGMSVTEEAKFSGSYGAQITSSEASNAAWNLQLKSPDVALDPDKDYTFSFYVKSDVEGKGRISFPGDGNMNGNEYPYLDWTGSGTESEAFTTPAGTWTLISVDITNTSTIQLSFDMGYLPDVTYYIDDVKVVEKVQEGQQAPALLAGPVIIEKSDEEKAQLIGEALDSWIAQMVGHYKNDVHAWDVVNEPMDDGKPSTLKTGKGKTLASDEFYWQDYLGKDYAVTAFNLARQHGNEGDKLFINDYNLEQNLAKCDGLIAYVQYIESQGATVDGIGTQMHISITSGKENIAQMFEKLAQTGKLIKISELDITVGTSSPTAENYAQQAEMYRYVVDMYMQHIPESQRYGITVWCASDNAQEHTNWLPDDAPCLWDAGYERKHAYKGFADGLAGKDVSDDFTGELQ